MSFHNYEKKVNPKTNKIRQFIDDQKKKKCSGKKRSKKKQSIQKTKEKNKNRKTKVFDEQKKMIRDNFFSF